MIQQTRGRAWLIAALTLLAAVLRFLHLGTPALWTDEAFSLWVARHSLPDIWRWTMRIDAHPPLYYIVLHYWLVFGDRETALRALSAVEGTLTVPVAYLFGRTVGGTRLGLVTAALLALSPFHVWYDQEARMYPLLMLTATGALLGLALVLREPSARGGWALYVLGMAAALWTEHSAALLLLSANVLVVLLRPPLLRSGTFLRRWVTVQGVILIFWSPVLVMLARQLATGTAGPTSLTGWGVAISMLPDAFSPVSAAARAGVPFDVRLATTAFGLCVVFPLTAGGLWTWRHDRRWLTFTLSVWLVPAACAILVGLVWLPLLTPATLTGGYRTLIWISLAPYLATAAGLLALRHRGVRAGALALLLVGAAADLAVYYQTAPKWEEWNRSADYIAPRVEAGDLILFQDSLVQLPFDYYFLRSPTPAVEHGVPRDFPRGDAREPRVTLADVPRVKALARSYRRVWLVYAHEWWTDPHGIVPTALLETGALADRRTFLGLPTIQIYLFSEEP